MFRTFCEDYNTATLPHRKYYDMQAYEEERAANEAANRDSDVSLASSKSRHNVQINVMCRLFWILSPQYVCHLSSIMITL